MRALVVATFLIALAVPAAAHSGHAPGSGLHLTDLVVTFDALSQSQLYTFTLENTKNVATGRMDATITLHEETGFRNVGAVGSLGALETASFTVAVPLAVAINGCIAVHGTSTLHQGASNRECAMTDGLTQLPLSTIPGLVPTPPAAPEVPATPELPPVPPTLP